jgi:uncharacterized repeat protein (TIGR01451 family)
MVWINKLRHIAGITLEISLVIFVVMLIWMAWGRSASQADSSANPASSHKELASPGGLTALQGTPLVTTVTDSISNKDSTFFGQRHFRSGIQGDAICTSTGVTGNRFYDRVTFLNTSAVSQTVFIGFTSSCGNNTYMVAYSADFDPANICANYLAGAGLAGNAFWSFKVCANSQFSLVVYGAEPGVTCSSYSYSVYGNSIIVTSQVFNGQTSSTKEDERWNFPATDTKKKRYRNDPRMDANSRLAPIEPTATSGQLLPTQGTPLVASIVESIDNTEPTFTGQRHFRSGIIGDTNCSLFGRNIARHYDEFFFFNASSTPQRVNIGFDAACGGVGGSPYTVAYSPQFDPTNICANYIAAAGLSGGPLNWEFTVCPNSPFSIVVYGLEPEFPCSQYSYTVFGNNITYLGTVADIAVQKTAPPGAVNVGSTLTYTITVTNNGPRLATGITLTDVLPVGTTFSLLSEPGTPVCTTPPVGSAGTITCNLNPLSVVGTALPNAYTILLRVNVTAGAAPSITNTATVSRFGIDPHPENNSSTVQTLVNSFDLCVQDESSGNLLAFNLTTGLYTFINCNSGLTVSGTGTLTKRGCTVILDSVASDRRIRLQVDTCQKTGTAAVQLLSIGKSFNFSDRNITNNTCRCSGGG